MAKGGILVPIHRDVGQRFHRDLAILPSWPFEQTQRSVAAHHDRFQDRHRKIPVYHSLLGKIADHGSVVAAQLLTGAVKNMQVSFDGSHETEDRPAEGGFP